jgi:hypothetical protein
MDNPLGDPLSIEMTDQVNQVKVLEQQRSVPDPLRLVRMRHGHAVRSGIGAFGGLGVSIGLVLRKVASVGRAGGLAIGLSRDVGGGRGGVVAHLIVMCARWCVIDRVFRLICLQRGGGKGKGDDRGCSLSALSIYFEKRLRDREGG